MKGFEILREVSDWDLKDEGRWVTDEGMSETVDDLFICLLLSLSLSQMHFLINPLNG